MQIVELSSFALRSAVTRFKKDGSSVEFALFPMIHVGERSYYDDIHRRLAGCD
jgi:hypothetical protein